MTLLIVVLNGTLLLVALLTLGACVWLAVPLISNADTEGRADGHGPL